MPRSANLRIEIAELTINEAKAYIRFRNDSIIKIVTAADTARHNRATVLIVDEARMVDKNTIDTVLKKFLTSPRDPKFLQIPEYANYPKERTKEIYTSSCWYESHWLYEQVRSYVVNMIYGRSYFCCAMPYQLPIMEGQLDRVRIEDEMSESTFSDISFRMEMECLFFGQSGKGLYDYDDVSKNRLIKVPFYPRGRVHRLTDKRLFVPDKMPGEIRILSADIALMSSTKTKNDATSIFINQMLPASNGKFVSNIVYTENHEGQRTDDQALIIRRLFEEYECDYLVLDVRGLGLGIYDALASDIYDPDSGITYGALSCKNNEDLASRCTVPGAPRVIWAVLGNPEFNSQCALGLREAIKDGSVRLLASEYDADECLSAIRGYDSLSPVEALDLKLPYVHTSLLVNELINLEYEMKNNVIRVQEKSGMRKDRYSSLSYNIFLAKTLERDAAVEKSKGTMQELVFQFRAPKIKRR